MNVLYLSYDGMTDPLGQSQVLPYLKGLSEAGYQISLISFEKEDKKDRVSFIQSLCNEIGVEWHPLNYTKRPPVLSTLWDIRQMKRLAQKLHKEKDFQLVHCRSYISALVGQSMKKEDGVKFLFDMRGFWADERVDGQIWNLENPIFNRVYKYFKQKEKAFFTQADHIISLTHNGKQEIESWDISSAPITVIPCCADLDLFRYKEKRESEKPLTIGYLGAIGTWYMLPEMLDFYKVLLEKYPKACFQFITRENPTEIIAEAQKRDLPLSQIKIEGANREDVPLKIAAWDLSIFFIKPVFSKKASSPTKQGEIMAMGKPIICNSGVGDTDYVIENYKAGVLVHHFDHSNYQSIVNNLDDVVSLPKENMIQGAKAFYSLEEGIKKYISVYQTCINDQVAVNP